MMGRAVQTPWKAWNQLRRWLAYPPVRLIFAVNRIPWGQGWRFYKNVADHLVRGKKLVITPEWGRRMIHVLDLAARSARAGRALKPKYA